MFFTLSLMHCSGRNFEKLEVVIHAAAFVLYDTSLYLLEFKKVKSFFVAFDKFSIPLILILVGVEKLAEQLIFLIISFKGNGPFLSKNWFDAILF